MKLKKLPLFFQSLYTIFLVIISWVIFRSSNINEIVTILKTMFGFNGIGNIDYLKYLQVLQVRQVVILIIGVIFSYPFYKGIREYFGKNFKRQLIFDTILIIIFLVTVVFILSSSYSPFIYYRF